MNPILFSFELPDFFGDVFGSFSLAVGVILAVVGFLFLFIGPDTRGRGKDAAKDADGAGDGAGGVKREKETRAIATVGFWFGLACLLVGLLVVGVNVLKSDNQRDAMAELIAARKTLNLGGGAEQRFVDDMVASEAARASLRLQLTQLVAKTDYAETRGRNVAEEVADELRAYEEAAVAAGAAPDAGREHLQTAYTKLFDPALSMQDLPLNPVKVPSYGVLVMLGFIVAIGVLIFRARQYGIDPNYIIDLGIVAMIFGIVGARIWYVVQYWDQQLPDGSTFKDDFGRVFAIQEGGLVFYGGLVLAAAMCMVYLRWRKLPFWHMADFVVITVPLGQAFGRIGCFLNGCCFGEACAYDNPFAVAYPDSKGYQIIENGKTKFVTVAQAGETVFASQLIASIFCLLVFILGTVYLEKIARKRGETFFMVFVLYGVFRFIEETLRQDTPAYGPFTIAQWFGIVAVGVGLPVAMWFRFKSKQRPAHLAGFDQLPVKYRRPEWAKPILKEAIAHEKELEKERAAFATG